MLFEAGCCSAHHCMSFACFEIKFGSIKCCGFFANYSEQFVLNLWKKTCNRFWRKIYPRFEWCKKISIGCRFAEMSPVNSHVSLRRCLQFVHVFYPLQWKNIMTVKPLFAEPATISSVIFTVYCSPLREQNFVIGGRSKSRLQTFVHIFAKYWPIF